MATIHFILQGKGGVGKSMVASFLYQSLRHFGKDVALSSALFELLGIGAGKSEYSVYFPLLCSILVNRPSAYRLNVS